MPTRAQTSRIIADQARTPEGRLAWQGEMLARAGFLPQQAGVVIELDRKQTALLIVAALLGMPAGNTTAAIVGYANLQSDSHGTLCEFIAGLFDRPHVLVRLTVSLTSRLATAYLEVDGAPSVVEFGADGATPLIRSATLDGATFQKIITILNRTRPPKIGRPRNEDRLHA